MFTEHLADCSGNKPFREAIEPPGRNRRKIWCQGNVAVISGMFRVPEVLLGILLPAIYGF
jgi:hypothetical protein